MRGTKTPGPSGCALVIFAILTPASLAYPVGFLASSIPGAGNCSDRTTAAVELLALLGLPLAGTVIGLAASSGRPPTTRWAWAACAAFIGSLLVWAVAAAFWIFVLAFESSFTF